MTKINFGDIITMFKKAELCKGSTADSDSVCEGSNPSSAAKSPSHKAWTFSLFYW